MSVEKTPDPLQQVVVATSYETKAVGGAVSAPLSPQSACAERRQYIARGLRKARSEKRDADRRGNDWHYLAALMRETVPVDLVKAGHARKPAQARGDNDEAHAPRDEKGELK